MASEPKQTQSEYGRRTYVSGNRVGYADSMREVPAKSMYDQEKEKQSEFKKPYISPDYDDMEYLYDMPDLKPWNPKWRRPNFPGPVPGDAWRATWPCGLSLANPHTCYGDVEGYFTRYVGDIAGASIKVYLKTGAGPWEGYDNYTWGGESIFPIHIHPPVGGWNGFSNPNPHAVKVDGKDAAGNQCTEDIRIVCNKNCCTDPGYIVMTFDDAITADTIAQSSNITVYVKNGCPPYAWSVTGTGYSMASPTTTAVNNVLSADGTACGVATVTITDDCGTSVAAYILCTTGNFHQDCYETAPYVGTSFAGMYPVGSPVKQKWYVNCSIENPANTLCGLSSALICPDPTKAFREVWRCVWGCEADDCWFA